MSDEHTLPEVKLPEVASLAQKPETDIQILEDMNRALAQKPVTPIDDVEKSLSTFVDDAFNMTRSEFEFQKQVQDHILTRLDKFTENQLIALVSNSGVNSADKIAKTMNPWVQLATARQQAQIQAESAERTAAIQTGNGPVVSMAGSALKEVNRSASKEVLQGMDALSKILEFAVASAKKENEPEAQEADEKSNGE